ncbi:IPTL-CTERM sorting domain-containing protein [Acidovorax sp. M2(2025)]|uniref:IPTL-CTERM sorting domain-containing protein n=1 Tax=Acidovorax sp. M2(2025) TaxID=3411355 RepID=UPI003BF49465
MTVYLDGAPTGAVTVDAAGNWSFTPVVPLAEGSHTVFATVELGGETSPNSSINTFIVDTLAPDTSLTSVPPALTSSSSATFAFSSNEGGVSYECSLDGSAFLACGTPTSITGLSDGTHTLAVRAIDGAGNLDPTSATYTWTVDTAAPDTAIVTAPPALANSSSASFSFSSNEGGVSYACSLDGSAFLPCSTPSNIAGLSDGSHTLAVRATDGAGNADPTPATYAWAVDTTAPDTTIATAPPVLANSSSATFTFSSNEGGVSYACSLDGAAFAPCSTPATFAGLASGAHTLAVRATDGAGNVDATPASHAWTVDVVAPAPPVISAPAAGSSMAALAAVSGSAEAGSMVAVFIDGAPVGTVTASGAGAWSWTPPAPLAAGSHTVHATATDAAGNASAASAAVNFSIGVVAAPAAVPSLGAWGLLGLTSLLGLWGLGALRRKG